MKLYKKAFTVVEIIIVALLIGIIGAFAYPMVKELKCESARVEMENDGRRVGAAAEAWFAQHFERTISLKYDAQSGNLTGPSDFEMINGNKITPGYEIGDTLEINSNTKASFKLVHKFAGTYIFSNNGDISKIEKK